MEEDWREVKGFSFYMVSNHGRVRSMHTKHKNRGHLVLKAVNHFKGYKIIFLYSKEMKNKKFFIHRLVAEAFIENPDNKPFVNHIDCNKANNHLTNLEWMTEQENTQWYHKNKNNTVDDGHEF